MTEPRLNYPLVFEKCPVCRSTQTVCNDMKKEAMEKGVMKPATFVTLFGFASVFFDPSPGICLPSQFTAPGTMTYLDVCGKCGAIFACRVERQDRPVKANLGPSAPPPTRSPANSGIPFPMLRG